MKNPDEHIRSLIARKIAGEASPEDLFALQAWLDEDSGNKVVLDRFERIAKLTSTHFPTDGPPIDVDVEWGRFLKSTTRVRRLGTVDSGRWIWRIAASFALVAVAAFSIYYFVERTAVVRYEAKTTTTKITLPDGSEVSLRKGSYLVQAPDFGKSNRSVTLHGEAFFEVKRDSLRPFLILAGTTTTEVLGTSFSVKSWDDQSSVVVSVTTGLVSFRDQGTRQELKLHAGQQGVFVKEGRRMGMPARANPNQNAWATRHIEFDSSPLSDVVATLNAVYGDKVTLVGTTPGTCQVTVTFDKQSLESVMKVLEATLQLTIRQNGDHYEIVAAGCK